MVIDNELRCFWTRRVIRREVKKASSWRDDFYGRFGNNLSNSWKILHRYPRVRMTSQTPQDTLRQNFPVDDFSRGKKAWHSRMPPVHFLPLMLELQVRWGSSKKPWIVLLLWLTLIKRADHKYLYRHYPNEHSKLS